MAVTTNLPITTIAGTSTRGTNQSRPSRVAPARVSRSWRGGRRYRHAQKLGQRWKQDRLHGRPREVALQLSVACRNYTSRERRSRKRRPSDAHGTTAEL
ncbi:MAG: hypothetical protein Tsb0020_07220 [Haliangiales bacterium]